MNFHFEPVRWSLNTNLYEVNLRQYTSEGTFQAFGNELPRLYDMGVNILWFMPITPISKEKRLGTLGSYYSCSNYTDTNPEFGTVQDFIHLVKKAHHIGFKVIIDWVANHTGWDHAWVKKHPGFYKRNAAGDFYDSNGWEDVIDLNYYDQAMRREMILSMEFWVKECNIDGFRCDMAHLVPLDFWRDARMHLDQVKPLFWLAETEHQNYQHVFDCSYAWHWMHVSENFAKKRTNIEELRSTLLEYNKKKLPQTTHLFFTSNHDENSWNGTEYEKYGNAALPFAVLINMWNGLSLTYSGQEIPNRKRLNFFEKDPIQWNYTNELHSFYKALFNTRKSFGEEQTEILMLHPKGDRHVIAFLRFSRLKQVLVIINLSDTSHEIVLEESLISGTYSDIFTSKKHEAPSLKNLMMEPWSYLVLEKL
ncbi:MAG: 1,4-alpha-glucan branching protein [Chitinophagaceae bacterium]|nr:1,4-alpha-glucan branching protein [Chitinophagaceae bacterium]